MKNMKNVQFENWIKNNFWNLLITFVGIIVFAYTLQSRINAVELRQDNTDKKVATYPSREYFDLKFQNLGDSNIEFKQDIKDLRTELQNHIKESK